MFFPSRMQVAKIIVPKKYTRNVTKGLQEMGCIEFIDIEHKALSRGTEHAFREEVFSLLSRITPIINVLELDEDKVPKKKVKVDETKIEEVLNYSREIISKTEDVISLNEQKNEIEKTLQELQEKSERILELTKHFGIEDTQIEYIGEGPYFTALIGRIETKSLAEITWKLSEVTDNTCYLDSSKVDKNESLIIIACLNRHLEVLRRVLRDYGFNELDTSDVIDGLKGNAQELEKRQAKYELQISAIQEEYGYKLLAARELLTIEKQNIDVTTNFRELSEDVSTLWGWIPKSKLKAIRATTEIITDKKCVVEVSKPELDDEEVPSNIEHKGIFSPVIKLITSYGSPLYSELDPTLFMFFTFPLIFGMMFADILHGAVVAICAVFALIAKRKNVQVNELIDMFLQGAELIFLCGISAIFWGFVFGSVGGDHFGDAAHPAHPVTPLGEFFQSINPVFWFSPMAGHHPVHLFDFYLAPLMTLLILSFAVAVLHMSMGLSLQFIIKLKQGHKLEAFTVPLMLLWLYLGAIYLVYTSMPRNADGLITRFSISTTALMANMGLVFLLAILPVIILMLGLLVEHGAEGTMEGMEYVLGLLSNTISYGRIVALNAVHGILSLLVLEPFVGFGSMLWILGFVLNTVLVGLLEGILAFIHTLRLHWVEWFSKFYKGTGKEFMPFAAERKFTQSPSVTIQ